MDVMKVPIKCFIIQPNPRVGKMKQILHFYWLPERSRFPTLVPHVKALFLAISFIDQAIAEYWPPSFFAFLLAETKERQKKGTRPICSHLDLTLGQ